MKRTIFTTLFTAAMFVAIQAFAMDLTAARSSGFVGEKLDGYTAIVGSHAEVQTLVNIVNASAVMNMKKSQPRTDSP